MYTVSANLCLVISSVTRKCVGVAMSCKTHIMDHVLRQLFACDTNMHHVLSFDNLINVHIPAIVAMYGKATTILHEKKYVLTIEDVATRQVPPSIAE